MKESIAGERDITATILRFGWRRRRWVIVLGVLLGSVAAFLVSRASYETDILELLPREAPAIRSFQTYVERFGGLDELYIVFEAPSGRSVTEYKSLVDVYVERLRAAGAEDFQSL